MTEQDYAKAASLLGCEPAAVRAVAEVESRGDGFLIDGRPRILFEAHVFSRLTGNKYDDSHPEISSRKWNQNLYRSSRKEHDRLAAAAELNREAALQSASWGVFQIMGFNWRRCGYESLQAFVNAMYKDDGEHLLAFCQFVKSMGLADELQRRDWTGFARTFNGPAYAANDYDNKMAAAYERYT